MWIMHFEQKMRSSSRLHRQRRQQRSVGTMFYFYGNLSPQLLNIFKWSRIFTFLSIAVYLEYSALEPEE